jgi:hypothetical protein
MDRTACATLVLGTPRTACAPALLFSVHAANPTAVRSIPELTRRFPRETKEFPMTNAIKYLAAAAAIGGLAAPAAAQYQQSYPYPQAYPQTYPQTYPQQYGQQYPGYGYNQGYAQNPVQQIIDQLLGNRYNVTDRQAVSQCATAALAQAQYQYRGYGGAYGGYQQGYAYNQNVAAPAMRVTAITDVQRRSSGLRVKGRISSGYGGQYGQYDSQYGSQYGQYANQYGYQNSAYGDLSFRCNVDYRGAVTGIQISRSSSYRRY